MNSNGMVCSGPSATTNTFCFDASRSAPGPIRSRYSECRLSGSISRRNSTDSPTATFSIARRMRCTRSAMSARLVEVTTIRNRSRVTAKITVSCGSSTYDSSASSGLSSRCCRSSTVTGRGLASSMKRG